LSSDRPLSETLTIDGPAGGLETLLEESRAGSGAGFAVVCHPHPLHGGSLQNKVVHTVARALQELGIATLRFNFRGVGASVGRYDAGRGELEDALAVIAYGRARWPDAPLTLAGFSFGALVALLAAPRSAPTRLITVAPPVNRSEVNTVAQPSCPWLIVQGDADEIVDFRQVEAFAARFTPPPQLRLLPGVTHLFDRHLSELRDAVTAFVTAPFT
jgi:uncharacterized protein